MKFVCALLCATLSLCLLSPAALAAIQVVIMDNGGTLVDREKGSFLAKKALLHKLAIEHSGIFSDDEIVIILTTTSNVEYRQNASAVPSTIRPLLPHIGAGDSCNDLVAAFETAKEVLRGKVDKAQVHVFSSLIHTPMPCDGFEANVPQAVPADLDLDFFNKYSIPITVYWAQRTQKRLWDQAFKEQGIRAKTLSVIQTLTSLKVDPDQ